MQWLHHYQLFLFDFDGILVDTEKLHYLAYQKTCAHYGLTLSWEWPVYARLALYSAEGLKNALYRDVPRFQQATSSWENFYQEKKRIYQELLASETIALMPGVEVLLKLLEKKEYKRCVVTHSSKAQVMHLRALHPILETIPHWITREDYQYPKPSPEGYQLAINQYAQLEERVLGFEDSPRGLEALLGTRAEGVLVSSVLQQEEVNQLIYKHKRPFLHASSFEALMQNIVD